MTVYAAYAADQRLTSAAGLLARLRRRFVALLAAGGVLAALVGFLSGFVFGAPLTGELIPTAFLLACMGILLLNRAGRTRLAGALLVTLIAGVTWGVPVMLPLLGVLALIAAAALTPRLIFWGVNALVFGQVIYSAARIWDGVTLPPPPELGSLAIVALSLAVVSFTTRYFISQAERAAEQAEKTATLLQAIADIGQQLSKLLALDQLLPNAVDLIRDRLAFYHVQVFLIDERGEQARLVASTGELGQRLLKRQHSLAVGSKSVIGQVTMLAQPVIARSSDAVYYRNELLPDTRSELAVPIFDAERIIGALDVQSRADNAFDAERVRALQAMANVLGTSIRNARLFEAQERAAAEMRRVLDERETQLRQIQRLNQQLTRSSWREYIREHAEVSGVTVEGDRIVYDDTWTDSLTQAGQVGEPVIEQRAGSALVAVPVKLGDEVIGVIEAETQAEGQSETIEMIQAVAQRLAISLDKARLFEETQNVTAQEQRISEIVARYQTVTHVDDLLHITLTELSDSLGAQRGAIRLSLQPSSLNGEAGHD